MIEKFHFGSTHEGKEVSCYQITNTSGMELSVLDLGGIIQKLLVPDKHHILQDVVLGFDTADAYEKDTCYLGACLGRVANRIENGRFKLNGREYRLACNDGVNHLHGGKKGFDRYIWNARIEGDNTLALSRVSPDGEEGYPGRLEVTVYYTLTDQNCLTITYEAVGDADTVVCLSNHSYFNLDGSGSENAMGHKLQLNADFMLPVDSNMIPEGRVLAVQHTPFDFRQKKTIGSDISVQDIQLERASGYDHTYILNGEGKRTAGRLFAEKSGIQMEVITDQPGVQLYTANWLQGEAGKQGRKHLSRSAVCLETQEFPNAVNMEESFLGKSPVLKAGSRYLSSTAYRFEVTGGSL